MLHSKTPTLLFAMLIAVPASANNLTAATAYSLKPNATAAEGFLDNANTERWYQFDGISGRSYCAETQGGVLFDTSAASDIDTALTVFRDDAVTVITSDDDDAHEPFGHFLSRACYIASVTGTNFVRVTSSTFAPGASFSYRLRIVDTTLFSNWFFLGGDYSAFTLMRNTTIGALTYTINYRNGAGGIVGTQTGTLNGNASVVVNARNFAAAVAAGSGTVEIVHNSSPDAIMATTTVLSATTGLGFDTIFTKRSGW